MLILRVWFAGVLRVVRAPLVVAGVYLLTLLLTVPVGALLQRSLPPPETVDVLDSNDPPAPDMDWLDEVSTSVPGLARFLSPEIIGAAAPMMNVSAILDGTRPPLAGLVAIAAFFLCWTALWGGVITRLSRGSAIGSRAFVAASRRSAPGLFRLGVAGGVLYVSLYASAHAVMFGPLYDWLTAGAIERTAFVWRVALAAGFGVALLAISQVLDYARLEIVAGSLGVRQAVARGAAMVWQQPVAVAGVLLLNGICFVVLIAGYAASEFVPGGSVPSLSRLLLAGQALILGRLILRMVLAAAQVELHQRIARSDLLRNHPSQAARQG